MPARTEARLLEVKSQFPLLMNPPGGKPLYYLDNAATTQKPVVVLDAMDDFYRKRYGTVRRGVYRLSEAATAAYEGTRKKVATLLNAASEKEIIYTRGTTEAINLVAYSYGRHILKPGDEIILSQIEHHANIVPWQLVAHEKGAHIKVIPVDDRGVLMMDQYADLLSERTRIVAVGHVANSLGTINPVREIIQMAHRAGAVVVVDGAQSAPHMPVDVRDLDADFFAFSGHKTFGPTGIGILYGKYALLEQMPPFQGGGDMITTVTFEKTSFQTPPYRFEAGTPAIAEVVGLGAAIDWVCEVGLEAIHDHEQALLAYADTALRQVPGLRIIGESPQKSGLISFWLESAHPHDIGTMLDADGVAVRAGHHCAQPTMKRFGVPATTRASFAPYNTYDDVDALVLGLRKIVEMFS